jgi:cytochrome b subunit of formate dehydrogenase
VLLIATTFGPSLTICVMELVHVVIGKSDPHHQEHVKQTERLLEDPKVRQQLKRFNGQQRVQHWFLVIVFATLCVTGFPIKFADRPWAAWTIDRLGGLGVARTTHHVAGALLIAGFFYHLGYILFTVVRQKRQAGDSRGWARIVWDLPMMVHPADGLYMLRLMLYMFGLHKQHPAAGRFNPEEKFEYVGVFWGTFVLGLTGVLMWASAWTTRSLPGRVLTIAALLHTFEAFLALLHVGIVHMASVIFSPGVFPISKAMFTGDTPAEELVHGHSEMLDAVERDRTGGSTAATAEVSHG